MNCPPPPPIVSRVARSARKLTFVALIFLVILSSFEARGLCSQSEPSTGPRRAAERAGLLPVPVHDLTSLDPSVSSQIRATAGVLDRALSRADSPAIELAEAFGMMGEIYQAYQLPASAEACYLNAIKLVGERFRSVCLLARVVEAQGRIEEAIGRYESALALEPNSVPILVHLGDANLQLGKLDESSRRFQEALKLDPNCAAAHAGSGQVALKHRDYAAALSALNRALELAPAANRLHYLLAMAYRGAGDQDAGRAHLQKSGSVGVRVDDPIEKELENLLQGEKVHIVRGRLAFMAAQYDESIREFRLALAVSPNNCVARVNLAGALASSGNLDLARDEYEAVARTCPESSTLHFNLGRLYTEKRQPVKALEHYRAALRLDPQDLATLLGVARSLAELGLDEQAKEHLNQSVTLHPDSEEAWYELCKLLLKRKEQGKARDRLEEACTRLPGEGRLTELLARLLAASPDLSLRDGPRALDLAQRVYLAAPTAYHAETLALALAETGRCRDAAAVLRQAIAILEQGPAYPDLLARMQRDVRRYDQGKQCRPPE